MAFALRRTPPTLATPYAYSPPVLRIPDVWFIDKATGGEVAVMMLMGDKAGVGNDWYPGVVQKIDNGSMVVEWEHENPGYEAQIRRR